MLAGEVFKAHVLSSLTSRVKHIIMIGDHKQLWPKVETHALTISAEQGHNLNLSMLERLIVESLARKTLQLRHRMRLEIASIARHMTSHTAIHCNTLQHTAAHCIYCKTYDLPHWQ